MIFKYIVSSAANFMTVWDKYRFKIGKDLKIQFSDLGLDLAFFGT